MSATDSTGALERRARELIEEAIAAKVEARMTYRDAQVSEEFGCTDVSLVVRGHEHRIRVETLVGLLEDVGLDPVDVEARTEELQWAWRRAHPIPIYTHPDGTRCTDRRCRRKHTVTETVDEL